MGHPPRLTQHAHFLHQICGAQSQDPVCRALFDILWSARRRDEPHPEAAKIFAKVLDSLRETVQARGGIGLATDIAYQILFRKRPPKRRAQLSCTRCARRHARCAGRGINGGRCERCVHDGAACEIAITSPRLSGQAGSIIDIPVISDPVNLRQEDSGILLTSLTMSATAPTVSCAQFQGFGEVASSDDFNRSISAENGLIDGTTLPHTTLTGSITSHLPSSASSTFEGVQAHGNNGFLNDFSDDHIGIDGSVGNPPYDSANDYNHINSGLANNAENDPTDHFIQDLFRNFGSFSDDDAFDGLNQGITAERIVDPAKDNTNDSTNDKSNVFLHDTTNDSSNNDTIITDFINSSSIPSSHLHTISELNGTLTESFTDNLSSHPNHVHTHNITGFPIDIDDPTQQNDPNDVDNGFIHSLTQHPPNVSALFTRLVDPLPDLTVGVEDCLLHSSGPDVDQQRTTAGSPVGQPSQWQTVSQSTFLDSGDVGLDGTMLSSGGAF